MNTLQNWNFIFLNVTIVSIHHKKEHILNSHEITCCSKFVTSKLNKVHKMKLGLLKKLFSKSALRKLKKINRGLKIWKIRLWTSLRYFFLQFCEGAFRKLFTKYSVPPSGYDTVQFIVLKFNANCVKSHIVQFCFSKDQNYLSTSILLP